MSNPVKWLTEYHSAGDGVVPVKGYVAEGRPPEEVVVIEKAAHYGADAVFFEAPRDGKPQVAQAFIFRSNGPPTDAEFATLHQQLWSWGGVPLVYRVTPGLVQLFRCAHRPDFEKNGEIVFSPFKTLRIATQITSDPWWDADRIRSGTLWDEPEVCKSLLSNKQSAQKTLINAIKDLHNDLNREEMLPRPLRRKLLILSVLVAYLEARQVFENGYFARFRSGAERFFEVLADGPALVNLLDDLENRFNGHVFLLSSEERQTLHNSNHLERFACLVEGRQERGGQLTLWQRYSFADLPIEFISHIYQLFVKDTSVAIYTPHFLVRLMVTEVLSWERLDRLESNGEVILDGACGSGIFLVEAFKRLALHWRYRNDWKRPTQTILKRLLTKRLRGVDIEEGAVELAAFSLCLALCDALEPMEIRASVKLFPPLKNETIHRACFFECCEQEKFNANIGVVVGNPPFTSSLATSGARRAYSRYQREHGLLPDKQLAYLFLHQSMEILAPGGMISMLQQYNFLYNQQSLRFRQDFIKNWDVREILDFISVRGLFQKGGADTKVIVIVAEASPPSPNRQILHATFRRSGRTDAEQGFDIDYYDMHWLSRETGIQNDSVWRVDTVGGGRVLAFVERLRKLKSLGQYAESCGWDFGEGWIEGKKGNRSSAPHITGKPWLPSKSLTRNGIIDTNIRPCAVRLFKSAYTERRFTPPMLLVRSQSDFHHAVWDKDYLTYTQRIVGFCGLEGDGEKLRRIARWLEKFRIPLQAFLAATSPRIFTQKSSALSKEDIVSLPFDPLGNFRLTPHEEIIASDIADHYRELIRLGHKSKIMMSSGSPAMGAFSEVFVKQINGVYKKNKLRALKPQAWPGVICQPYIFGTGNIEWSETDELRGKIDTLLRERRGSGLNITRIARLYDGPCIYLLKPNRFRYWLRSVALRDSDETLADLSEQGF